MHTYRKSSDLVWTVGFYDPEKRWIALRDFTREADAMIFTNYLNGGTPTLRVGKLLGDTDVHID